MRFLSVELQPLVEDPEALPAAAFLLTTDITTRYGIADLQVIDASGKSPSMTTATTCG
jgi:hypothetical protein